MSLILQEVSTQVRDCKRICEQYSEFRLNYDRVGRGFYHIPNVKRCKKCDIWIQYIGWRCPCCGKLLRTRAVSKKFRSKLPERRIKFFGKEHYEIPI